MWDALRLGFDVFYALVIGGCSLYVFFTERKRVTQEKLEAELKAVDDKIASHDTRITRVESDVRHIPTHADIGGVYQELRTVNGGVKELNGEMKALRGQVELMTKHMLDKH